MSPTPTPDQQRTGTDADPGDRPDERSEPPVLGPGATIAPGYEVVAHLSRGHRLDVYDAWSLRHHARCVVKTPRPDCLDHEPTRTRLTREGRLLRDLVHPHLVRAFEVVGDPARAVALETLTGPTVAQLVDAHGPLGAVDAALLGSQVASALAYLHAAGYVHGDVTAGNVVVEGTTARVIDLSLAARPGPVRRGSGTGGYAAPEQSEGAWVDEATDVWGLGQVLREALTATPPGDPSQWRDRRRAAGHRRRDGEAYAAVEAVTARCLRPDRLGRPDLAEVAAALESVAPPR